MDEDNKNLIYARLEAVAIKTWPVMRKGEPGS